MWCWLFIGAEEALRRREAAHAPFREGMRVRLNERFPYSGVGRVGTVTRLPRHLSARYIHVLFDDNKNEVAYCKDYFDVAGDTNSSLTGKSDGHS